MRKIGFIPVRCGSKSIPLKNIKLLGGKPLVYWVTLALTGSKHIDEVIIATDCRQIIDAINQFKLPKIKIYERKSENASDTSTTESVLLEYIDQRIDLKKEDIFCLAQATSPFTQSEQIDAAFDLYINRGYDSMLSVVRTKRFFWSENGLPLNYDYHQRPRRQEFKGMLMENGAFYLNRIKDIVQEKNRLSGNIGLFEMPDYTALELDEPDDWSIAELFIKRIYQNNDK